MIFGSKQDVSTSVWQIEQLAVVFRDETHTSHVDSATPLTNKRRLLPVVLSLKKKKQKKKTLYFRCPVKKKLRAKPLKIKVRMSSVRRRAGEKTKRGEFSRTSGGVVQSSERLREEMEK